MIADDGETIALRLRDVVIPAKAGINRADK
jgi:hypothetical protein